MKKLIIAVAALMVSIAAYGQGQFNFNNRLAPDINARFITSNDPANGSSSSIGSPDWSVKLLAGAAGQTLNEVGSTTFRGAAGSSAAGYVTAIAPTVAGVAPGASADVLVRVLGPGGVSQDFPKYTLTLGGGTATPPNLPLGTSPLVVNTAVIPEPTTLALGALGLGALLFIRRRK